MNCPACSSRLAEIHAYGLKLDVCSDSCGGIWFDAGELELVDEAHERVDARVLRPMGNQKVAVDRNKPRSCPNCEGVKLDRQLEDELNSVEIDICKCCGGAFLDFGELKLLRESNSSKQGHAREIDDYMQRYAKDPANAPKGLKALCVLLFRG